MEYIRIILFIWIGLGSQLNCANLRQNSWYMRQFTNNEGLSSNSLSTIVQDTTGYLWFGTTNGLDRFDGIEFKNYQLNWNDSLSLPGNNINHLLCDSKGQLLVATSNGLALYNRTMDNFIRIKTPDNSTVKFILEDQKGNYWFATQGSGLQHLSQDFKIIHHYGPGGKDLSGLNSNYIWSLYEDSEGFIWICTEEGDIYLYYPENNKITLIIKAKEGDLASNLFIDKDHTLIVCAIGRVRIFSLKTVLTSTGKEVELTEITNEATAAINKLKNVRQCFIGFDNNLWVIHQYGFSIWDQSTSKMIHSDNNSNSFNWSYNLTSTFSFIDNKDNLWMATNNEGVVLFSQLYNNFNQSGPSFNEKEVISILEDSQKNLWVGTGSNGVYCIDNKSNTIKNYSSHNAARYGFSANCVFKIFETSDNQLYFGSFEGLFFLDKTINKFKRYSCIPNNPKYINHSDIRDIIEDESGNIWIATNGGGVNILNPRTQTFSYLLKNDTDPIHGIVDNYCLRFLKDKNGNIWIGTYNGFTKYDITNKHYLNITNGKEKLLSHNWIYDLHEDPEGHIWLATPNGLNIYKPESQTFELYSVSDGLPDNSIVAFLPDEQNSIWISTANGLCKFDWKGQFFISFSEIYYPMISEFIKGSKFKDSQGELFFGGIHGYVRFQPSGIKVSQQIPKVVLTNLKLFNNTVLVSKERDAILTQNIGFTKKIRLNHSQNIITLEYTTLNFLNPEQTKFAYQLIGFDKDWNYLINKRDVTYTNLNPGTYVFQIKATNEDGIWNQEPTTLIIEIIPPFWDTLWFKSMIIIIILSLIYAYYRYNIHSMMVYSRELEEAVKQRTKKIQLQNQLLEGQAIQLKNKNLLLETQASQLNQKNQQLESQTEQMKETNNLLKERQLYIQEQTEKMISQHDELSKLNATKDKLFSILSHDLRAPFNTIIGFSELLIEKADIYPIEKIKSQLTIIRDSSLMTYNLLENLLNWSRAQRGIIKFNPESVNLTEIIQPDLGILQQQAVSKDIEIKMVVEGVSVPVKVDVDMFKVIIRNFISNAIKYSPKRTTITVTFIFEQEVKISVADNGIGMDQTTVNKILNREDYSTTAGTGGERGTGLGLLIAIDFIDQHKGHFYINSDLNKGSVFSFTLPYNASLETAKLH